MGGCYDNEETTAHASDTLARKLMRSGEQYHKLNFRDDETEVHSIKQFTSKYIGVSKKGSKWRAARFSKIENKSVRNGRYDNEETAAHASDNLARKLKSSGEQKLKLNFPDDEA